MVAHATAIDSERRQITLSNGDHLDYDAALLATGTRPRPVTIDGATLPHVRTLRSLSDVDGILRYVNPAAQPW